MSRVKKQPNEPSAVVVQITTTVTVSYTREQIVAAVLEHAQRVSGCRESFDGEVSFQVTTYEELEGATVVFVEKGTP